MKKITTYSNSFVLQEIDSNGRVLNELGYKKGGLSYRIVGQNVKFYLVNDYFYKNVVWSTDCPLVIDNIPYQVEDVPEGLKKIFINEGGGGGEVTVDVELDKTSYNPIANAPVATAVESLQTTVAEQATRILNTYTKAETNSLLESFYTKLQTNAMFADYSAVNGEVLLLNNNNII